MVGTHSHRSIIVYKIKHFFSKCVGGEWSCTSKTCPGLCAAWGEGHYKTFDDKMFDFTGNCEYILARGQMTPTDSFSISIKNVFELATN